jgi:hypothetical protein
LAEGKPVSGVRRRELLDPLGPAVLGRRSAVRRPKAAGVMPLDVPDTLLALSHEVTE